MLNRERICRVCGRANPGFLWEDVGIPAHGICDNCENQSGMSDSTREDILFYRSYWNNKLKYEHDKTEEKYFLSSNKIVKNLKHKYLNEIILEVLSIAQDNIQCYVNKNNGEIDIYGAINLILDKEFYSKSYKYSSHLNCILALCEAESDIIFSESYSNISKIKILDSLREASIGRRKNYNQSLIKYDQIVSYCATILNRNDIYANASMFNCDRILKFDSLINELVAAVESDIIDDGSENIMIHFIEELSNYDTDSVKISTEQRAILERYASTSPGPSPGP